MISLHPQLTQANHSCDNVFELNRIIVDETITFKPRSAKFVKIPKNSKFGNWKIFEYKQIDNVFIPSSVFNTTDGCFTILIL